MLGAAGLATSCAGVARLHPAGDRLGFTEPVKQAWMNEARQRGLACDHSVAALDGLHARQRQWVACLGWLASLSSITCVVGVRVLYGFVAAAPSRSGASRCVTSGRCSIGAARRRR
jgi:hypothetical protein